MTSLSGQKKNEVLTELKAQFKTITGFENSVFKGMRARVQSQKAILIHLTKDNIEHITTEELIHEIQVNLLIKATSSVNSDQEVETENFIELVGTVEDKLEAISNHEPYWEHMLEILADYTFKADEAMVYHNCLITLLIRKEWSTISSPGSMNG